MNYCILRVGVYSMFAKPEGTVAQYVLYRYMLTCGFVLLTFYPFRECMIIYVLQQLIRAIESSNLTAVNAALRNGAGECNALL